MQTLIARSAFLLWMFTLQNSVQGFGERDVVSPKFGKHRELQKRAGAATRSGDDYDESSSRSQRVDEFPSAGIVGGKSAKIGMNPWQVAIIRRDNSERRPFCGGSLISNRHVLTAGHCVFKRKANVFFDPAELIVRLGAFDWTDQRETSARNDRVKYIIPHGGVMSYHDDHHDHYANDIALLVLHEYVVFGAHIDKIRLPQPGDDYAGQMARITGWGLLEANGTKPKQLQSVEVKIFNHTLVFTGGELEPVGGAKNEIYAGSERGGKGSCNGDSGGPLSVESKTDGRRVLVGVVARASCGDARAPLDILMRVTYYLPWIKAAMKSI